MRHVIRLTVFLMSLFAAGVSVAQSFPSKAVRLVVPSAPGGSSDVAARLLASELEKRLGQPAIVENRTGAGQSIAASVVAKAAPDGYTLYFAGALSPHPIFTKNNAVDAKKEFSPVSNLLTFGALYFMASTRLPVTSFRELVAYSRANPGKLNYANVTPAQELAMAILKSRIGLSNTQIPYKADSQIITAFKAGEADIALMVGAPYIRYMQDGTLRPLFIAASKRSAVSPDVPTSAEVGVPNFEVSFNIGLWAPAGTPRDVIQRLNSDSNAVIRMASIGERLRNLNAEPLGSTPEEQLSLFEADVRFFSEAARLANFEAK